MRDTISSSSAYACRPKAHLTAAHFPSGPCGSCCSSSCCLQLLSVLAEMPEQAVNLPHFQTGEGQRYKCEQTLLAIVLLFAASGFATAFRIAVGRDPWKILPDSHTAFSRISYDLVILPTPLLSLPLCCPHINPYRVCLHFNTTAAPKGDETNPVLCFRGFPDEDSHRRLPMRSAVCLTP